MKYNIFIVGGSLEINPNDPKFSKAEAEALQNHLWMLRGKVPKLVQMKEEGPVGDYEYNVKTGDSSYSLKYGCGHEYHASPDTWFRPKCVVCMAAMEKETATNERLWSKRLLPGRKPVIKVLKDLLPPKDKKEVK
jgi:hypothetical protein